MLRISALKTPGWCHLQVLLWLYFFFCHFFLKGEEKWPNRYSSLQGQRGWGKLRRPEGQLCQELWGGSLPTEPSCHSSHIITLLCSCSLSSGRLLWLNLPESCVFFVGQCVLSELYVKHRDREKLFLDDGTCLLFGFEGSWIYWFRTNMLSFFFESSSDLWHYTWCCSRMWAQS